MKKNVWMLATAAAFLLLSQHRFLIAQDSGTVPVHLVVAAESTKDATAPQRIDKSNVNVKQGKNQLQVTDWIAAQGDAAALQLFILIDDTCVIQDLGTQMNEIRTFINAQPSTTLIALGYMRNTVVTVAQDFTNDHQKITNALRLPLGSLGATDSPYLSLMSILSRWPASKVRREVIMVTDGIDRIRLMPSSGFGGGGFGGGGFGAGGNGGGFGGGFGPPMGPGGSNRGSSQFINPDVNSASAAAQRLGVIVNTIYSPGVGRAGRNYWELNNGQNQISKLSEDTGGESFFLGTQPAVSFQPYLDRIQTVLNNQYYLVFRAKPGKKGELQRVKISTEVPDVELISADNVWVPAPSSLSKEKDQ
jgi:hypothetical protein